MKAISDYALNPTCKTPNIVGKRLTDKWFVYFYYYVDSKRYLYRESRELNINGQSLAEKRKKANDIYDYLDSMLKTHRYDHQTKSFQYVITEGSLMADLIDQ
ncbi:hypothetical protein FW774_02375 (plasmid) [Pedobacter sp. BS3]|uniref:hypothetical protein n=1 Tax=Pedobacter sp. BS3 TaxID=2567937 RepID=UPI0011EC9522|nr:hypothetical protein [Pedobacter sp. BS3]TZF85932.1 hypothetical protein FW774_02375 [Pedobacter sp. BS3]